MISIKLIKLGHATCLIKGLKMNKKLNIATLTTSIIINLLLTAAVINNSSEVEIIEANNKLESQKQNKEINSLKNKISKLTDKLVVANQKVSDYALQEKVQKIDRKPLQERNYASAGDDKRKERMRKIKDYLNKGTNKRLDFFSSIDTANFTDAQKESFRKIIEKMELLQQINDENYDEMSLEDRAQLGQDFIANIVETNELMDEIRDATVESLATDLGYADTDAEDFSNYVKHIYDMTSMQNLLINKNDIPKK